MAVLLLAVLMALSMQAASVKQVHINLRDGCGADSDAIAALPAGAPVTIRYAIAGEAIPCYKVTVQVGGRSIDGYLAASALDGLDQFDQSRRDAAWLDWAQVVEAVRSPSNQPSAGSAAAGNDSALVNETTQLIRSGEPSKALELLEPEAKTHPNPGLLALAGAAAWRADDSRKALEYWRESLDLQPNPDLENLYRRVERETKGDQSTEKLYGTRVVLRYEPGAISADTARQMTAALDSEFADISAELGCNPPERIVAIAQSRDAYRKTTDAAEWSAGQFDGRIRVPFFNGQGLDASMRRILAHEITHACLTQLGQWPSWLQEGLAQKLSGDAVTPALRRKLALWTKEGKLPRLSNLRQDWSRLDAEHAAAAYGLSLEAVELYYTDFGLDGIRNLLHNPERLPQVTADLDKRLGL